jgi:hypothetical protein
VIDQEKEHLKNCPFCNSAIDIPGSFGGYWVIICPKNECKITTRIYDSKDRLFEMWNKRDGL